jgi:hypothetical protein
MLEHKLVNKLRNNLGHLVTLSGVGCVLQAFVAWEPGGLPGSALR